MSAAHVSADGGTHGLGFFRLCVEPFNYVRVGLVKSESERPCFFLAVLERRTSLCFCLSHLYSFIFMFIIAFTPCPTARHAERVKLDAVNYERFEDIFDIAHVIIIDLRPCLILVVVNEMRKFIEAVTFAELFVYPLAFEHLLVCECGKADVLGPGSVVDVYFIAEISSIAISGPFDRFIAYEIEFACLHLCLLTLGLLHV